MLKRQAIIDALVARLKLIVAGATYYTTIKDVFLWRTTPFDVSELPVLNVRDGVDKVIDVTRDGPSSRPALHELGVEIDIVMVSPASDVSSLRKAIVDVEKAIVVDETFGGLSSYVTPGKSEIVFDQNESRVTGATISLTLNYQTHKFQED